MKQIIRNLRRPLATQGRKNSAATKIAGAWLVVSTVLPLGAQPANFGISGPAYDLVNTRTAQNQQQFYVFEDMDSGYNHGFPSGLFGNALGSLVYTPNCVYDSTSPNGCSSDPTVLDQTRGTVFQMVFSPLGPCGSGEFVGLNFEEPQGWGVSHTGNGYNLSNATGVELDAISPTGGLNVQFSVAGAPGAFMTIPQQWTQITIPFNSLGLTPAALSSVNLLFGIASNDCNAPNGGTILLDNIQFQPVPTSETTVLGFPIANADFGILHVSNSLPGSIPIPPDEINANLATTYESSIAVGALLARGLTGDLVNANLLANTLVYALGHDNQGDPLPVAPDGSTGLHNGMFNGDLALFNGQGPGAGQQGQVRLSGFSASGLCPPTGFCLVLDGATGGNNAFAVMALVAAYGQTQDTNYLSAAITIGDWIYDQLLDSSGTGYGGYFTGYPDEGLPKVLETGKSTENNADIFTAFSSLANLENALNNPAAASIWTTRANIAGDFVMQMFDATTGHFYAGTVPVGQPSGPGITPDGPTQGNDVINTYDFLDAQTFTTLAMAGSPRYQNQIDWRQPIEWVPDQFPQTITVNSQTFQGFDLIDGPEQVAEGGPAGVAWEFTGQTVAAMQLVDGLYNSSQFAAAIDTYLTQIRQAQTSAPFGDGQGVVAATMQDGQAIVPYQQCLVTPYQCIAERVGLAATLWAIFAEQGINPLAPVAVPACTFSATPSSLYFDATAQSGSVIVTPSSPNCYWTAAAAGPFLSITAGSSGMGNGAVDYVASANPTGSVLTGSLTIANISVPATQRETAEIFADVIALDYYFDFANVMYTAGITSGCSTSPLDYCPDASATRAEMAVFPIVAIEGSNNFSYTTTPYFTDVPASSPYFKFVQKLKDLGITDGCSATQFCPNDAVTRGEMAVFIIQSRYGSVPYTYPSTPYFTDVPATNAFFPFVQKMAQAGITAGCAPSLYCPDETLTRGQMAVFVVTGLLNELLAAGTPYIATAAPNMAAAGQTVTAALTGVNTHFVLGTTQVTVAPGITASNITVTSGTSLTVQLAIGTGVPAGPTTIVALTGSEEAVLPNGFTVQ